MATRTPVGASVDADELTDTLREAITSGRMVPDQRLVEIDLCEAYGASRGNVRAALAQLTSEGLVVKVANRGARVRAVSVDEAIEITEVRAALESLCAAKAAERVTAAQCKELRELGRTMEQAVQEGDRETYSTCNQRLHARLIEISGQGTAAATIRRLHGQAVRFQFRLAQQPGRPNVSLPQHLAIIEAVCERDPQAADTAMRAHLASVSEAIRAVGDH